MTLRKLLILAAAAVILIGPVLDVSAQKAVMWSAVDISRRDLFNGPGGVRMRPTVRRMTLIRKEPGGNNLKYRVRDGSGREWVAKIADESQAEVAAVRLLWALGYRTEIDYLVPALTIPGQKMYRNVRMEARPANIRRGENWLWEDNPFVGTNELQGLKIMMALINNWDLKATNNVILNAGGEQQYVVSDLGSSFGKLAVSSTPILNRFGRSVNKPEDYARSDFLKGVTNDGFMDFAYKGNKQGLFDDVTRQHGRWIGSLLRQLSDRQISDAFRAANYSPAHIRILTGEVRARINELVRHTSAG